MSARDEPPAVRMQTSSSIGILRETRRGGWIVSERSGPWAALCRRLCKPRWIQT